MLNFTVLKEPMRIKILYFAITREATGQDEESLELPSGLTIGALVSALVDAHAKLGPLMPYVRLAVNEVFEHNMDRTLVDGDTVALIPPVAGGRQSFLTTAPIVPSALEESVEAAYTSGDNVDGSIKVDE